MSHNAFVLKILSLIVSRFNYIQIATLNLPFGCDIIIANFPESINT